MEDGDIVKSEYTSRQVTIPDGFLVTDLPDARPLVSKEINWRNTDIPEFEGRYAVVVDNVLSPSECETLVRMAEESVIPVRGNVSPWRPALVNIGGGLEALDKGYRNSDRIIWDNQVIMDRLWARCAKAEGLRERLAVVDDQIPAGSKRVGRRGVRKGARWEFERFNERGRYLRYTSGQYFRPHCDGAYSEFDAETGKVLMTYYTVHLYLNDSFAEMEGVKGGPGPDDLVGGATSFLSHNEQRRVDVNPKVGRILIFEHDGLYHCGDDVEQGVKLTMRTDIMYRLCQDSEESEGE